MAHVGFHFQAPECRLIYSHYNSISTFQFLSQNPHGGLCRLQVMYILSECLYQSSAVIWYQPFFMQGKSTLLLLLQQHFGSHCRRCVSVTISCCCSLNLLLRGYSKCEAKRSPEDEGKTCLFDLFEMKWHITIVRSVVAVAWRRQTPLPVVMF